MALSLDARNAAVSSVIARCGDAMLGRLVLELSARPERAAQMMLALIEAEQRDRRLRDETFAPILPMFAPRADGLEAINLPPPVLGRLWRQATLGEPELVDKLEGDVGLARIAADRLCRAAAAAVRDRPEEVWPLDVKGDTDRSLGLDALARRLDLSPLARDVLPAMEAWLGRASPRSQAELRLLIRDADAIGDDGGTQMMEILFSHLDNSARAPRILMQAASGMGGAQYLAHSDMGRFIDRILEKVRSWAGEIAAWRLGAGTDDDRLGRGMSWCAAALAEMDMTLSPAPDSGWGQTLQQLRAALGDAMSALIVKASRSLDAALPLERAQMAGRMTRMSPRLDAPPTGQAADQARQGMAMLGRVHKVAHALGCEAERMRAVAALIDRLMTWSDEAIEAVNAGEAADEANALRLVLLAADALELIEADTVAHAVRRRAAVAGRYPIGLMRDGGGVAGASPEAA